MLEVTCVNFEPVARHLDRFEGVDLPIQEQTPRLAVDGLASVETADRPAGARR